MADTTADRRKILLESGTNEVEIAELMVGSSTYGINVAKIQQIIQLDLDQVTRLPDNHPALLGVILFREQTIPLIDLYYALNKSYTKEGAKPLVMVTYFNKRTVAFVIHAAERIHRLSWSDLQPMSSFVSKDASYIIGTVSTEGKDILVLDIEHLTADILPDISIDTTSAISEEEDIKEKRSKIHVIYAEDSKFIRSNTIKRLKDFGYSNVTPFENGEDAYKHITDLETKAREEGVQLPDKMQALLTDIEMPKMDGLTLCRNLKQEMKQDGIPVIMFSSLISKEMENKCKSVGADLALSKPQVEQIVENLDQLCLQ